MAIIFPSSLYPSLFLTNQSLNVKLVLYEPSLHSLVFIWIVFIFDLDCMTFNIVFAIIVDLSYNHDFIYYYFYDLIYMHCFYYLFGQHIFLSYIGTSALFC